MSSNDYDMMTHSGCQTTPGLPVVMPPHGEKEDKKFERFARQVCRCTQACSLCDRGLAYKKIDNTYYDPHVTASLTFSEIALIKHQPSESDVAHGLFGEHKKLFSDLKLDFKSIYKTSVIKCYAVDANDEDCPYFELEMRALKPKLVIVNSNSSFYSGFLSTLSQPMKFSRNDMFGMNVKTILVPDASLKSILKMVKSSEADPQVRNLLLS